MEGHRGQEKAKRKKAHNLRGRCLKTLAWLHGSVFGELKAGGGGRGGVRTRNFKEHTPIARN